MSSSSEWSLCLQMKYVKLDTTISVNFRDSKVRHGKVPHEHQPGDSSLASVDLDMTL